VKKLPLQVMERGSRKVRPLQTAYKWAINFRQNKSAQGASPISRGVYHVGCSLGVVLCGSLKSEGHLDFEYSF
jgi:hypothetical protein